MDLKLRLSMSCLFFLKVASEVPEFAKSIREEGPNYLKPILFHECDI